MYSKLLSVFIDSDYKIDCFKDYLNGNYKERKIVILRHDIDRQPINALNMAKLENDLGVNASYYFRIVKESYDENIIKQIAEMEHEIGYHYENLSEISKEKREKSEEKLFEFAMGDFRLNLEKLRKLYPVKTICMHGSPLSKWDNRDLWNRYDYRDFGIIGEPYFDIDFNEVLYLTDTGRRWNGHSISIRDTVSSSFNYSYRTTRDIISALKDNHLPDQIMINSHPQRWDTNLFWWCRELVWQNTKNIVKRYLRDNVG